MRSLTSPFYLMPFAPNHISYTAAASSQHAPSTSTPLAYRSLLNSQADLSFAKYVKTVSFGREELDLINPIHDEDIKLGNTNHPVVASEPLDDWTLEQVRVREDSSIIAQALTKLPNLRMVIASHRADSSKKLYRKVFDGRPYSKLTCVSGHCRPTRYEGPPMSLQRIFKVVAMALEQMRPERLGLEIGLDDYNHIQANLRHPDVWYTSGFALHRITYLKVPTIHARLISRSPVCQILDAAPIDCLDIELKEKDTLMFEPYYHPVANPLYQLQSLRRLVVKKLWAPTMFILESIRAYKDRLTHVTIIGCSVVWPSNARHGYTDDTVED